jgi:hypothetical protein
MFGLMIEDEQECLFRLQGFLQCQQALAHQCGRLDAQGALVLDLVKFGERLSQGKLGGIAAVGVHQRLGLAKKRFTAQEMRFVFGAACLKQMCVVFRRVAFVAPQGLAAFLKSICRLRRSVPPDDSDCRYSANYRDATAQGKDAPETPHGETSSVRSSY